MNEIRPPESEAREISRIRAIVEQVKFPDFVDGFEVQLGEFDDEPSMWIIFHTTGKRPVAVDQRKKRVEQLSELKNVVHRGLMSTFTDRYPYYRFANRDQTS